MTDTPATTPEKTEYTLVQWIKLAISTPELPDSAAIHLNGYGERAEVKEAIATINMISRQAGLPAVQTAWKEQISKSIPDVAELVNRPRLIFHISELEKRPPVEWLIPSEIPARLFTVIYGQPEAGKTFLAIDYAGQIVQRGGKVLYVAGEGDAGYYARYHAWMKHCGHKKEGAFHIIDRAIQLLNPADVDFFIEAASEIQPTIVFFDTLSRCMVGGDENNQKDMGLLVHACDRIRKELNCAVVMIHHTGKTGDNERGSSVLRGAADMMISVAKEEDIIKISCGKSKDSSAFSQRYCRLMEVTVMQNGKEVTSCVMEAWQRVKRDSMSLTSNQVKILECLASQLFQDGVKVPDLRGASNVNGSTFYHALNGLMKKGYAVKLGGGAKIDPVIITPEGRDWIRTIANPDNIEMDMRG